MQLRRKEGSKYAGQVGGEWPTKFWKRVKSGSCLFTRMKKRILSRGEGGGDACRVIWNTLCERWIRSMDAEHYFSLSLSLSRLFARSLSLSNIRHDFFPFLDSPSWQTTRSRVLAHDNFILTCFLVWCVDTKVGLKVSTRRLCNWITVSLLKKKYSMKIILFKFHDTWNFLSYYFRNECKLYFYEWNFSKNVSLLYNYI